MKTDLGIVADVRTASEPQVRSSELVLPPASEIKVGDDVWVMVKGISNNREYKTSGEVVEIRHGHFATVRYKQPWGKWRRDMVVDLRHTKKINRRQTRRQNEKLTDSREGDGGAHANLSK